MSSLRRSDSKKTDSKKTPFSFRKWGVLAALVVLAVVAISLPVRSNITTGIFSQKAPVVPAEPETQEPGDASSKISGQYVGLCKQESVNSVEDFRKTVFGDPVLAAHFSGFDWNAAKLGKLDKEVWTFVSYRKGDEIRQTSKPVRLPQGDGYVTDGVRMVRTYCCNDYVLAPPPLEPGLIPPEKAVERVDGPLPRKKTSAAVPPPVDDPAPQQSPEPPAEGRVEPIPEPFVPKPGDPPLYPPVGPIDDPPVLPPYSSSKGNPTGGNTPGDTPGDPTTIVTPEPGTFVLMGAGAAVIGIFRLLRRKRKD